MYIDGEGQFWRVHGCPLRMLERHKSIYFQEARLEPARVQEPSLSSGVFGILKSKEAIPTTPLPVAWKPLMPGTVKLNFDGGVLVKMRGDGGSLSEMIMEIYYGRGRNRELALEKR